MTRTLTDAFTTMLAGKIPAPTSVQPPGTQGLITVLNWVAWGVTFLCVVGVFMVAGKMVASDVRDTTVIEVVRKK